MTYQTFGENARWHPHIYTIVADGLFRRNGVFYVMPMRARLLSVPEKRGRTRRLIYSHYYEVEAHLKIQC